MYTIALELLGSLIGTLVGSVITAAILSWRSSKTMVSIPFPMAVKVSIGAAWRVWLAVVCSMIVVGLAFGFMNSPLTDKALESFTAILGIAGAVGWWFLFRSRLQIIAGQRSLLVTPQLATSMTWSVVWWSIVLWIGFAMAMFGLFALLG